jgi:hypothetical protein
MDTDTAVRLSGWCAAPAGAKTKCQGCRWDLCEHDCHNDEKGDD